MNSASFKECQDLALLAELARPLVHECNNFLNNLFLQFALAAKEFPEAVRADWERIRQNGLKLGGLLQEWQNQRRPGTLGGGTSDLQLLLQEIADEVNSADNSLHVTVESAAKRSPLLGTSGEIKRLCYLLLWHAMASLERAGCAHQEIIIQFAMLPDKVRIEILEKATQPAVLDWADFEADAKTVTSPLLSTACNSMAERLQGSIGVERVSQNRRALVLELPMSPAL